MFCLLVIISLHDYCNIDNDNEQKIVFAEGQTDRKVGTQILRPKSNLLG